MLLELGLFFLFISADILVFGSLFSRLGGITREHSKLKHDISWCLSGVYINTANVVDCYYLHEKFLSFLSRAL